MPYKSDTQQFGRDIDIGKYSSEQDRMEVLLTHTLTVLRESSLSIQSLIEATELELKRIRIASEVIIDEEVEPSE